MVLHGDLGVHPLKTSHVEGLRPILKPDMVLLTWVRNLNGPNKTSTILLV